MSIRILTDSASDLTLQEARELGVDLLPLRVAFGEGEYLDGVTLTHEEFYNKLIECEELPMTSQINPAAWKEKFEEVKANGDTAVVITLSSKLSGTYQSAMIALDGYEDCIQIVDSLNACAGQRLLVEYACQLREQMLHDPAAPTSAMSGTAALAQELERVKKDIRLIALLDTLEYLKKGGRISAAAAAAGTLLSLKPVLCVDDGVVSLLGKARGSKNGSNLLNKYIQEQGPIDFSRPISLVYTGLSDALIRKYAQDSAALYEGRIDSLPITRIGAAVGTHIGPGAIGLAFFKA